LPVIQTQSRPWLCPENKKLVIRKTVTALTFTTNQQNSDIWYAAGFMSHTVFNRTMIDAIKIIYSHNNSYLRDDNS
jgi:hypothetical protein